MAHYDSYTLYINILHPRVIFVRELDDKKQICKDKKTNI